MDECETSMRKHGTLSLILAFFAGCVMANGPAEVDTARLGLGQPATTADIRLWNIDVAPSGEGLPPGRGTVPQGATVYAAKCAKCHGASGTEGPMDRLVGGQHSLATTSPVKTVGSYWPYATTLYDYIHRAMPFDAPQSLTPDEVYSVTAWLLHRNGIIAENAVIDSSTLPAIQMPNRHGFVPDPRPDVHGP
jgi:S-disulfanyl-L-cysteine oxidoreductase SoxD